MLCHDIGYHFYYSLLYLCIYYYVLSCDNTLRSPRVQRLPPFFYFKFSFLSGIEPVDPEILVFAYHCGAKEMGLFTRTEFSTGLTAMGVQ